MRYFHYTAWSGRVILNTQVLEPSASYMKGGPKLVWLTTNDRWESCIQASPLSTKYERGPSDPEVYTGLGIPCWRFTVEIKKRAFKIHYNVPGWVPMLQDAVNLNCDLSEWHWVTEAPEILKAERWKNGQWKEVELG